MALSISRQGDEVGGLISPNQEDAVAGPLPAEPAGGGHWRQAGTRPQSWGFMLCGSSPLGAFIVIFCSLVF